MAEVEHLILDHLRHLRAGQELMREDTHEMKVRMGHLEEQVAGLHGLNGLYASVSARIDRIDQRLERVERRLDLTG